MILREITAMVCDVSIGLRIAPKWPISSQRVAGPHKMKDRIVVNGKISGNKQYTEYAGLQITDESAVALRT